MIGRLVIANERGAALIVVLLLVATLSFIALAISERTALAANRAANIRLKAELFWRGAGVEALARRAIAAAMAETPGRLSSNSALLAAPIDIPFETGAAKITVSDRTRCFNVNSLVALDENGEGAADARRARELDDLFAAANENAANPAALTAAIVDWIDADDFQTPQGAEDGFYTSRPTPYRTGAALLADISELRAMAGVDRARYARIRPFLCAHPTAAPSVININMMRQADAPLLLAILGGDMALSDIEDAMNARPPGGYETADAFWADEVFAGRDVSAAAKARIDVYSRYLEVNAAMDYDGAAADLSLLFEVDADGRAQLIARRLGRDD